MFIIYNIRMYIIIYDDFKVNNDSEVPCSHAEAILVTRTDYCMCMYIIG